MKFKKKVPSQNAYEASFYSDILSLQDYFSLWTIIDVVAEKEASKTGVTLLKNECGFCRDGGNHMLWIGG